MSNDRTPDGIRALWEDQPLEGCRLSLQDIRRRGQQLDSRIRRRNLRQIFIAMVVVAMCTSGVWAFPNTLVRVGLGLEIVAMFLTVYHLQTRSLGGAVPEDLTWSAGRVFLQRSLEIRRDFVREVWTWQILPMVPGGLFMLVGFLTHAARRRILGMAILVVFVAQLAFARMRFRQSEKRYQREIEALDVMKEP